MSSALLAVFEGSVGSSMAETQGTPLKDQWLMLHFLGGMLRPLKLDKIDELSLRGSSWSIQTPSSFHTPWT